MASSPPISATSLRTIGKSKAGALMPARKRSFRLHERFEDVFELFVRHPDAAVRRR